MDPMISWGSIFLFSYFPVKNNRYRLYMHTTIKSDRLQTIYKRTGSCKIGKKIGKPMKYEIEEPHRTPEWYRQAGESMQKKANYLRLGLYQLNCLLEDPEKHWSWQARKDMQREKGAMDTAIKRIEETYKQRCSDLKGHPDLLQAFQNGFLGS